LNILSNIGNYKTDILSESHLYAVTCFLTTICRKKMRIYEGYYFFFLSRTSQYKYIIFELLKKNRKNGKLHEVWIKIKKKIKRFIHTYS